MRRALRRERHIRRPLIRAKIYIQEAIAGKPNIAHVRETAEAELLRTVHAAPPAHGADAVESFGTAQAVVPEDDFSR